MPETIVSESYINTILRRRREILRNADGFYNWYEQSPENTLIDRMNNNPLSSHFFVDSIWTYDDEHEADLNELIEGDKKMFEPHYCWFCRKTLKKKHVILIDNKHKNRLKLNICPECKHTYDFFVEKVYRSNREKTIDTILKHTRTYPLSNFEITKAQLKTEYIYCACCRKKHMRTYSTLILNNIGQYRLCKDCEYEYKFLLEKTKRQVPITTKDIFDKVRDCTNIGGLTKCLE